MNVAVLKVAIHQRMETRMRLSRVGCVVGVLLLSAHVLAAQSPAADSIGLDAINRRLRILPEGRLATRLTMGAVKQLVPNARLDAVGPTAAGWALPTRSDSMRVGFVFDWDSGTVVSRGITDNAVVSRIDIYWLGTDRKIFEEVASMLLGALSANPVNASCLRVPPDIAESNRSRRVREAAWYSPEWIASLVVSASSEGARERFVVQYRAFRRREELEWSYKPLSTGRDCLPTVDVFRGDSLGRN